MPPRCRKRPERPWRHGRRLDPPEPCAAQRRRRRPRTPRSPARHGPLTRTRRFGSRAPHCRTPPRGGCLAPGAPLQPAAGNSDGLSPAATCQAPRGFQVARARPKEEGSTTSSTTQATLTSSHPRWPASRPTPSPNPAVDPLAHTVDVSSSPHYPILRTACHGRVARRVRPLSSRFAAGFSSEPLVHRAAQGMRMQCPDQPVEGRPSARPDQRRPLFGRAVEPSRAPSGPARPLHPRRAWRAFA